jgi:hypothetical protein
MMRRREAKIRFPQIISKTYTGLMRARVMLPLDHIPIVLKKMRGPIH